MKLGEVHSECDDYREVPSYYCDVVDGARRIMVDRYLWRPYRLKLHSPISAEELFPNQIQWGDMSFGSLCLAYSILRDYLYKGFPNENDALLNPALARAFQILHVRRWRPDLGWRLDAYEIDGFLCDHLSLLGR